MTFLTVKEFAEISKIDAQTVRRAIKAGKINAMRPGIGKKTPYRIPKIELERLVVVNFNDIAKE